MGQKTNPIGLRLGIVKTWDSRWFAKRNYAELLQEDLLIKRYLKKRLYQAGISKITIERKGEKVTIGIKTARPGLVIGRKGEQVDKLSEEMKQLTKKQVQLNIEEIKRADLDAQLVAEHIAKQLEQRVSFRRAMKKAIASSMRAGAQGIRICCTGRLGGSEMARFETYREGRVPLHTLRADIDFARATANTAVRHVRREGVDVPRRSAGQARGRTGRGRGRSRRSRPMLMPKRVKYRKQQRGRMNGKAYRGSSVAFGEFGLQALEPAWVTNRQIEAARVAITRSDQARRQDVDPGVPGQAGHEEAGRDPNGKGQGRSGVLGRGGQARPRHVRDSKASRRRSRRRRCGSGPRSCRSGRASSSATSWEGSDMTHVKPTSMRETDADEIRRASRSCARSCSTCASATR